MHVRPIIRTRAIFVVLLGALALVWSAGASPALGETGAPRWDIVASSAPTLLAPGGEGELVAVIVNLGSAPVLASEKHVTITDTLPIGVEATGEMAGEAELGTNGNAAFVKMTNCKGHESEGHEVRTCEFVGTLPPYIAVQVHVPVKVATKPTTKLGDHGELLLEEENEVTVAGANASPKEARLPLRIARETPDGYEKTPFGVERYELVPEEENGEPDLKAGTHPFALTTTLQLNQILGKGDLKEPNLIVPEAPGLLKNLADDLPPGLLGNITVPKECSEVDFSTILAGNADACPADTAIGVAVVTFNEPFNFPQGTETVPVFNLEPAAGEPARFGFEFEKVPVSIDTAVRTGEGYGVQASSKYTSEAAGALSVILTIWGSPEAESHDEARGWTCLGGGFKLHALEPQPPCELLKQPNPKPYLTLPTYCSEPLKTSVQAEPWNSETYTKPLEPELVSTLTDCDALPFEPSLSVRPDESAASTPSGLTVEAEVPQASTLSEAGPAEADVAKNTLILPPGMQSSAGAANGLETCGTESIGFDEPGGTLQGGLSDSEQLFTAAAAECPGASKLGTVSIATPLLEHELTGAVYLGSQDTDPFKSPLVLYLVAEEPITGTLLKLAGEVKIDQATGQLESVFSDTPPLPFSSLKLHLFDGPRASQATPSRCEESTSVVTLQAWSGQGKEVRSSFTPTPNPDGQPCPTSPSQSLPFAPSIHAGATDTEAGAFTPFTVTIGRPDGDQALETIDTELPPGVAALISEVPLCSQEQAEAPEAGNCPAESLVGHTTSDSGLGGSPVTLGGQIYLTGPLKATSTHGEAPFGLLAVTRAKAGPFDLGYVKILSTININETTAQAIVKSEPIPKMLDGVPVQLKALNVTVERPEGKRFQFNPTNCSKLETTGSLSGYEGAHSAISDPFEVTNCAKLPFEPKLTASVKGQGSKANGTTFAVTIESPGLGQANIHKVDLTIPSKLPSRLSTIQKACLEVVFDANPASCDEGSVIGEGIVHTPVFKNPLRGPAYLVSHGGAEFPDVEFVLQGEGVKLVVDGKTYIHDGITYSKFETSPDAPFTKFESIFPEGPHSALTPDVPEDEHYNLCKASLTIPTEITAQNGAFISETTNVAITGCSGVKPFKITKAEELAKALKACRTKYKAKSKKRKRLACEKAARKKYGAKASKGSKKKSEKKKK